MAEPKTRPTDASVPDFLAGIEDGKRRADAQAICALFSEMTGEKPVMWGPAIVGFGSYVGPTGRWMVLGFSPRKANFALYGTRGSPDYDAMLARLGKHSTAKGCLYLTDLAKVDMAVLKELVASGVAATRATYG